MTTQNISIKHFISDNNTFSFKTFKSECVDQLDVFHKGNRVAIIEGISGSLLKWTCSSEAINIKNIDKLEKMVSAAYKKATKHLLA